MTPMRFPYLEVAGTHRDVGRAIGETFRQKIQNTIARRREEMADYERYLRQTRPFVQAAKKAFPQLVTEAEAIAEGAGVGFADYFFINNREADETPEESYFLAKENEDHCTVAVSPNHKGAVVGHNEDWAAEAIDELFVLKATIGGTTFLGLQYAVTLAGDSATMNSHGLIQCINSLFSANRIGVPRMFLSRAVLECRSLDEAEQLIRQTDRASSFNHVLVQGREVRNVEIAGDKLMVEKVVGQPYVHTNHYLSELKKLETYRTKSSVARYERACQLVKPDMTKVEMEALLSDRKNKELPICRPDATIGSVIMLPEKGEVWICRGHPCAGEYCKYTL